MLRIGVDGGGTTTRAVVIDGNQNVYGRGEAPSSNAYSVGWERAVQNVLAAIATALQAAQSDHSQVEAVGLGLAGACSETEQSQWRDALLATSQSTLSGVHLVIDEDAAAAQKGAFGGEEGAVCIAGTGSNCFGFNARGERARADGLGPLLGDRGSGYWIGESALRAACRMHDSVITDSPLRVAVLESLQAANVDQLVQRVYAPDFDKSRVAALFLVVLSAAVQHDAEAEHILHTAGTELAQTAASVLNRLQISRVATSGGVLNRDSAVRRAFEQALQERIPNVQISEPLFDAAIGAALLSS